MKSPRELLVRTGALNETNVVLLLVRSHRVQPSRSAAVIGNIRGCPVLLFPASIVTTPAAKSTFAHVSGSTPLATRQPVM